jgi:hypothetical protein
MVPLARRPYGAQWEVDLHKAHVKLRKVRERPQGVQEQSAAQIQVLTAVNTKLSAAIVAALLSTSGQR